MQPAALALALMLLSGAAQAQGVLACSAAGAPPAVTAVQQPIAAALAPEMVSPSQQLGAPSGVLAQALDESLSVDQVLYRIRMADCTNVASLTPAPSPGALPTAPASSVPIQPGATTSPDSIDAATYVPRTEFDNAPWRFDMNQNGKKMTADEFTAWMEAKGVRVVKPRATVATAGQVPGVAAEPENSQSDAVTPPTEDAEPTP